MKEGNPEDKSPEDLEFEKNSSEKAKIGLVEIIIFTLLLVQ